jgi:TonB family protein
MRAVRLMAALLLVLVAAGRVSAQDAPTKPADGGNPWIAQVTEHLKLTTEQKAALLSYEALVDQQNARAETTTDDQFRAMTSPERADYFANQLSEGAAKMHARADALRQFYALLTPEQRSEFDEAGAPRKPAAHVASDTRPAPLGPPPNNFTTPNHTDPTWLVRPTQDNISRVYPTEALRKQLDGHVMLQCTVDTEGYLFNCVVREETPAGSGFGNAALEITAYIRMTPATSLGLPTASSVEVPINFLLPNHRAP